MADAARPWDASWPAGVPRSIDYPSVPAWWLLERNLADHAERIAVRHIDPPSGRELAVVTYRQLFDMAAAFARQLQAAGIRPGDRVLLYCPNSPGLIAAYHACWMAGAIAVACSPQAKDEELRLELDDSGAATIVCAAETAERAAAVASAAGARLAVIPPSGSVPAGALALRQSDGEAGGWQAHRPADPRQDVAALLYTGGTTGVPKGAMLTHYNVVANTLQFATWYGFETGRETCVCLLPLFHSGGFSGAMNVPVSSGATLLLMDHLNPVTVARTIQEHRATRFFGVPTHYIMVLEDPAAREFDLSSLKACRTSAAPLPPAVKQRFDERVGHEVLVEGYGLTEASPLTHANPVGRPKPGSIGLPLSDTDARIQDGAEEGELLVRGPQVMKGYWNKPEETAAVLREDGWLRTGDLARMDEDGYFYIVDRIKDVINAAGFKVWPREVEEALYRHPAVRLAAVVGAADPLRGESVKAYVVLKDGAAATESELIRFCRQHLSAYKVPRGVEFRTELPISGPGKILRRALRE
jgi:long-chain acyl-CoA synthetase